MTDHEIVVHELQRIDQSIRELAGTLQEEHPHCSDLLYKGATFVVASAHYLFEDWRITQGDPGVPSDPNPKSA